MLSGACLNFVPGLKVILDIVPNHSSDKHTWFEQSQEDKDGKYGNYYVWHNGDQSNPDPKHPERPGVPNNWVSIHFVLQQIDVELISVRWWRLFNIVSTSFRLEPLLAGNSTLRTYCCNRRFPFSLTKFVIYYLKIFHCPQLTGNIFSPLFSCHVLEILHGLGAKWESNITSTCSLKRSQTSTIETQTFKTRWR